MLPCLLKTAPDSAKYAKASYVWRDQRGRGMLRARATIFGNGSLHLKHLRSRDSDTYYCDVFLPDLTKDTVVHNVIGMIVTHARVGVNSASPNISLNSTPVEKSSSSSIFFNVT